MDHGRNYAFKRAPINSPTVIGYESWHVLLLDQIQCYYLSK